LPIIGLTGGVGSGKSTIARILESKGAVVVDADAIGRQMLQPGRKALQEVRSRFGDQVIAADGSLNRAALAQIVFSDPVARSELEAITHPEILAEIARRIDEIDPSKIVIIEAPLLYEARERVEKALRLDGLIVVASRPEDQIDRLVRGRGMSPEDVQARISAQATLEEKVGVADYVIDNYGTLEDLEAEADILWNQMRARF
jgi:dephospho-CoA kinase